ncbi:MAG: ABC-F family ATP-binding cassette domain-containing protein [Spirochaetaceae bacterium]|jgi:ATP-binding cassette subfamily F protein 3|nr:ABC-F family ATP-binding cassette domain-containing protein [Spirochaetaceae bacterium]
MKFARFFNISLSFGDRDILKDAAISLSAGSRAALTGANGSGKSTLMQVMAGTLVPDRGERAVEKGARIVYLPQSGAEATGKTVREEAESAYCRIRERLGEMDALGEEMRGFTERDAARTAEKLEAYRLLEEEVEGSGYYTREARIKTVLAGLGFAESDAERSVADFSGGWRMRIALAKTLLAAPDIMLLDEPTNYLDIEARAWLENFLRAFKGGCLLVSHDRYFLDSCVNEVYELFQGTLKRYAGNYSTYEAARQGEIERLIKVRAAQDEEIAKTEALVRRWQYKPSKAALAQERMKRLEKMKAALVAVPAQCKKIRITLPPHPARAGKTALTLTGVGRRYGPREVLRDLTMVVAAGERLAVVGKNGAGKTTLLRILAGADTGFTGEIKYGAGVDAGYFSQDSSESLTGSDDVLSYIEQAAPPASASSARDLLGAFLFHGDDVYKSLSVLSGGEKSRLCLLRMLLRPANLLILDEPTNHLDLYAKDALLAALEAYGGTIVFVSHDRAFMEALSTKTLELSEGRHRLFYGGYGYYLERAGAEAPETAPPGPVPLKPGAREREEAKARRALERRRAREEEAILAEITALEAEKAALEASLGYEEVYRSGEKTKAVKARLAAVRGRIEERTAAWEAAQQPPPSPTVP